MSDLTARLRATAGYIEVDDEDKALMVEAAEELERLEALNAELAEQVQALDIQVARLRDVVDR